MDTPASEHVRPPKKGLRLVHSIGPVWGELESPNIFFQSGVDMLFSLLVPERMVGMKPGIPLKLKGNHQLDGYPCHSMSHSLPIAAFSELHGLS